MIMIYEAVFTVYDLRFTIYELLLRNMIHELWFMIYD